MKRVAKILASLFALGVLLLVGFHLVENWRGKRAWERWKAQRTALGARYDWTALAPPEVPDAENFAKAPIIEAAITGTNSILGGFQWQEASAGGVSSWRLGKREDLNAWREAFKNQDLESALEPCKPDLDRLTQAMGRARCRLPFKYNYVEFMKDGYPPLLGMRSAGKALRLRALARLEAGKPAEALEDVLSLLRLSQKFKDEPTLLVHLLQTALIGQAMQPIWEGVSGRQWNGPQLLILQRELEGVDLLRSHYRSMESERVFSIHAMESMAKASYLERAKSAALADENSGGKPSKGIVVPAWLAQPSGWIYQDMLYTDRLYTLSWLPSLDVKHHRVDREAQKAVISKLSGKRPAPHNRMSELSLPPLFGLAMRIAERQNAVDEAVAACAIERHRLAKGNLPSDLTELSPTFLSRVPVDLLTGEPLRYQVKSEDTFQLVSAGWNFTPEATGTPVQDTRTTFQPGQESWLWPPRKKVAAPRGAASR